MIFDEMRKNFLIIGFTGPLRSGCTTAAKYLKNNIHERIVDIKREITSHQNRIKDHYKALRDRQDKDEEYDVLLKRRKELLNDIKARQILTTLKKYSSDSPRYISMTDMLIKTVVESIWSGHVINGDDRVKLRDCKLIITEVKKRELYDYKHDIVQTNDIIKKREYHKFSPTNPEGKRLIKIHDKYLKDITDFRESLRTLFVNKYGKENGIERLRTTLQDMGGRLGSNLYP
jgi:hypothetical protein